MPYEPFRPQEKRTLERQIHSACFERLLKSQQPEKLRAEGRSLVALPEPAIETLKNPYVLEFLGLPEVAVLHETDLESAILSRLQAFLLELGKPDDVARAQRLVVSKRSSRTQGYPSGSTPSSSPSSLSRAFVSSVRCGKRPPSGVTSNVTRTYKPPLVAYLASTLV